MITLKQIQAFIDKEVNPKLALHKGSCEAVDYGNGVLKVKLLGGCSGCPSAKITLYNGVAPVLAKQFEEIEEVDLVI